MIWNINNSIANFDKEGLRLLRHLREGKPTATSTPTAPAWSATCGT